MQELGKALDKVISDAQTSNNSSNSKSKSKPKSNPFTGAPGSTSTTYDDNGNVKQERKYGPDGYPSEDVDHDHDHDQYALDLNSGRQKNTIILLGCFKISEQTIDTKFYFLVKKYNLNLAKPHWRTYSSGTFIFTEFKNTKARVINSQLHSIAYYLINNQLDVKKEKIIIEDVLKYMKAEDVQAIRKIKSDLELL